MCRREANDRRSSDGEAARPSMAFRLLISRGHPTRPWNSRHSARRSIGGPTKAARGKRLLAAALYGSWIHGLQSGTAKSWMFDVGSIFLRGARRVWDGSGCVGRRNHRPSRRLAWRAVCGDHEVRSRAPLYRSTRAAPSKDVQQIERWQPCARRPGHSPRSSGRLVLVRSPRRSENSSHCVCAAHSVFG